MNSCCFTGHRQILGAYIPALQKRLQKTVKNIIKQGVTTFYCGEALGFDTLAAQAVLKARRFHPQVKLILALPCRNQAARWMEADRLLFESIKMQADEVKNYAREGAKKPPDKASGERMIYLQLGAPLTFLFVSLA